MLVLSRKIGEQIRVGEDIMLTVVSINGNVVRLGLEAPKEVNIVRAELTVQSPDDSSGGQPYGR